MGWLVLVGDCDKSRSPVRDSSPHFPAFEEYRGASYAARYDLLCRKLVREQLYTTATMLLSTRTSVDDGSYSELSEMTGLKNFVATLAGQAAAEAARTE